MLAGHQLRQLLNDGRLRLDNNTSYIFVERDVEEVLMLARHQLSQLLNDGRLRLDNNTSYIRGA